MINLPYSTSISGETEFCTSITENFGWIEPVFLLISPNLKEVLRLEEEPSHLLNISNFEIIEFEECYALKFIGSKTNDIVKGNTSKLRIVKAKHNRSFCLVGDKEKFSLFKASHTFSEISTHQEYCFYFIAQNTSFLTHFSAFAVDDYT